MISKNGQRYRPTHWLTVIVAESEDGQTYFGTTVSRKVGIAVVRNKLKRWVRHCVRSGLWPKKLVGKRSICIFRSQPGNFYKELEYKEFKQIFEKF